MGVAISDLPGIPAMEPTDMFESEKSQDNTSYRVTLKQMMDYFRQTTNNGFKGTISKSLDDFTVDDVGVWLWISPDASGEAALDGLKSGFLEVISVYSPEAYNNTEFSKGMAVLYQRLSLGPATYQRMYMFNEAWSPWGALKNENGYKILSGESNANSDEEIWFDPDNHSEVFPTKPAVTVTPINGSDKYVYIVNVHSVNTRSFKVQKYLAPLSERKVVTSSSTTKTINKDTSGTETTTETATQETTKTDGSIVPEADTKESQFSFSWIAMAEQSAVNK